MKFFVHNRYSLKKLANCWLHEYSGRNHIGYMVDSNWTSMNLNLLCREIYNYSNNQSCRKFLIAIAAVQLSLKHKCGLNE